MQLMPIVVGGPLGAGKNYVADVIVGAFKRAGIPVVLIELGDHYYEHAAEIENKTVEYIRAHKPAYRAFLQEIGGDPKQQQIAIEKAVARCKNFLADGLTPVVTARKAHEIAAFTAIGARGIGVHASLETRLNRVGIRDGKRPSAEEATHNVEVEAKDLPVDIIVPNDLDAGELYAEFVRSKLILRNEQFGRSIELSARVKSPALKFSA